jgi:hypothetical protein
MSENIRITDLAEPELSELQKSIHAYGETLQVNFDASEILEEAKAEVSLDDFGPLDFLERLELMGPDFASCNFEWLCQCPRWRDHYYASDQTLLVRPGCSSTGSLCPGPRQVARQPEYRCALPQIHG